MAKIQGMFTALITPFNNGRVDEAAFEKIIEYQISSGISGLVACGSTGEGATLSEEESIKVIQLCSEITQKRVPVIANIGSNNTAKTIELANKVSKFTIDAIMTVVPYYNKPTQRGIYAHFKAVHDSTNTPIILYNVPGRTIADMSSKTVLELTLLPRIIALKDATSDLERPIQVKSKLTRDDFSMLSGEDSTMVAFNASGGQGCISVAANALPKQMVEIQRLCQEQKYEQALAKHIAILPLYEVLFCEANPIPIKYVLSLMGFCKDELRLPLCELSSENKEKVRSALKALGAI